MLHDQNGLLLRPGDSRPDLSIVVVNNDGGGIFSGLEQAAQPSQAFERLFGTPHGVGFDRVAAWAGIPHTLLRRVDELPEALATRGPHLIEIHTDRKEQAELRRQLLERVAAVLSPIPHATSAPSR